MSRLHDFFFPPSLPGYPISYRGQVLRWIFVVTVGLATVIYRFSDLSWKYDEPTALALFGEFIGLAGALYLAARRRELPFQIAYLAPLCLAVSSSSTGAALLAMFSMATRGRWQEILPNSLLFATSQIVSSLVYSEILAPGIPLMIGFVSIVPLSVIFYAVAVSIGERRKRNSAFTAWQASEQQVQSSRVQEIRALERTSIAREMHDVLAHRISMVALHSGALAYREDMEPKQVHETAQLINDNARLALSELREVLGTLRTDQISDESDAPQPTLAQLPLLWEEANTAVAPVSIVWHGLRPEDADVLQESTSRNAYRVIQEGLTNARKHAPGIPVQVSLSRIDPRFLRITLVNRLAGGRAVEDAVPFEGFGLIGMTERVRSSGGTITAGPSGDLFVVDVALPWVEREIGREDSE
jgi:signal transduction histidine kinase